MNHELCDRGVRGMGIGSEVIKRFLSGSCGGQWLGHEGYCWFCWYVVREMSNGVVASY